MIQYLSTRGSIRPVRFDEAVLSGFAADGGLFVPDKIPHFSLTALATMARQGYTGLAFGVIREFIDPALMPDADLAELIAKSFSGFEAPEVIPTVRLKDNLFVQELFHGPTLSFKDIAMGFLINCMDYFLQRRKERLSLVLATTGDTGPAAAYAAAGKTTLECWPLYPKGMISEEQERQMTTLGAENVHPVGVTGCKNGGDDLDVVVANLFANPEWKRDLKLSSVNSINWCRVLVQTIHYFHSYFQVVDHLGEEVVFSVPAGAFGNLCAGFFARSMGLPVKTFICATNDNATLHRVFAQGVLSQKELKQTVSSAIDIVIPYNFWRFLYFNCDGDAELINRFVSEFEAEGAVQFPEEIWTRYREGFRSTAVSDEETLATMREVFAQHDGYLLDPHGAVALAAVSKCDLGAHPEHKVICLATAHPAKFPAVVRQALDEAGALPEQATHPAIEAAKIQFHHLRTCRYEILETALTAAMRQRLDKTS